MEKKNLVSFEVAKLLKAKGYDEPCAYSYWDRATSLHMGVVPVPNSVLQKDKYAAPTRQDAEAWLREKHNVYIGIKPQIVHPERIAFDAYCWEVLKVGIGTYLCSSLCGVKYEDFENEVIAKVLQRL